MSDLDPFGNYEPEQPATLEEDRPEPPRPRRRKKRRSGGGGFYSFLTAVFLLGTVGVVVVTILLINNPLLPFNPLRPAPPQPTPTLFILGGGGGGGSVAPPTPTATSTLPPTQAPQGTPGVSASLQPTPTGLVIIPGGTATVSILPFTLQNEAVTYTQNANDEGCRWLSIAGQVFDINGDPLPGLPVEVTGENFQSIEFTGTATQFGPSGYEVLLNTTPIEAEFVVQLLNTTGQVLSEPVVVRTLAACDSNVAIVNFIQNHPVGP